MRPIEGGRPFVAGLFTVALIASGCAQGEGEPAVAPWLDTLLNVGVIVFVIWLVYAVSYEKE